MATISLKKQNRWLNAAATILSVALVATPLVLPPCGGFHGGTSPMHCQQTMRLELGVAIIALAVAGLGWSFRNATARRIEGVAFVLLAAVIVILPQPWALSICRHDSMDCHQTAHWLLIWAYLLGLTGVSIALLSSHAQPIPPADPWENRLTQNTKEAR